MKRKTEPRSKPQPHRQQNSKQRKARLSVILHPEGVIEINRPEADQLTFLFQDKSDRKVELVLSGKDACRLCTSLDIALKNLKFSSS